MAAQSAYCCCKQVARECVNGVCSACGEQQLLQKSAHRLKNVCICDWSQLQKCPLISVAELQTYPSWIGLVIVLQGGSTAQCPVAAARQPHSSSGTAPAQGCPPHRWGMTALPQTDAPRTPPHLRASPAGLYRCSQTTPEGVNLTTCAAVLVTPLCAKQEWVKWHTLASKCQRLDVSEMRGRAKPGGRVEHAEHPCDCTCLPAEQPMYRRQVSGTAKVRSETGHKP